MIQGIPELAFRRGQELEKTLRDKGIVRDIPEVQPVLEDGKVTFGSGYPIKAVEKFLGYYDPAMKIAYSPSISFCNNFSITRTYCMYTMKEGKDLVFLDGVYSEKRTETAKKALDIFRSLLNISGSFVFYVERQRRYTKAKGLSESSSVASSVSRALVENVFGHEPKYIESLASRFAKFVSGSGTRSAISGLSIWLSYPRMRERDCFAHAIPTDLSKIKIAIFPKNADFTTNQMHELAVKSPQYPAWVENKFTRISDLVESNFDPESVMQRAEEEMLAMNSMLMAGGTVIQTDESLSLIERIIDFRKKNPGLYFTADTGPSVLVMSQDESLIDDFCSEQQDLCLRGEIMQKNVQKNSDEFRERAKGFFQEYNKNNA